MNLKIFCKVKDIIIKMKESIFNGKNIYQLINIRELVYKTQKTKHQEEIHLK